MTIEQELSLFSLRILKHKKVMEMETIMVHIREK